MLLLKITTRYPWQSPKPNALVNFIFKITQPSVNDSCFKTFRSCRCCPKCSIRHVYTFWRASVKQEFSNKKLIDFVYQLFVLTFVWHDWPLHCFLKILKSIYKTGFYGKIFTWRLTSWMLHDGIKHKSTFFLKIR